MAMSYSSFCLEGLRQTMKSPSHNSQLLGSNRWSSSYKKMAPALVVLRLTLQPLVFKAPSPVWAQWPD